MKNFKCGICGRPTTWETSFGPKGYIVCARCHKITVSALRDCGTPEPLAAAFKLYNTFCMIRKTSK